MTRSLVILPVVSSILFILFISSSYSNSQFDHGQNLMIKSSSALTSVKKPNITILMMFPDIDRFIPNLKSLLVVYEYIVHRYNISQWLNINLQIKDSNCSIALAPHQLVTTMLSTIPDVVFGPFCGNGLSNSLFSLLT